MYERMFLRIAHYIRDFCAVCRHGKVARQTRQGTARASVYFLSFLGGENPTYYWTK